MAWQVRRGMKSVLALGAHPDDLELGCGGTLAKLSAAGVRVEAIVFTCGENGHNGDFDRRRESIEALGSLGVSRVVHHDMPDTRLHEHLNELIRSIEEAVEELSPQRVYTMFDRDRHQDHRAVHQASIVACRRVPQILGYETPSSYPNFMPTAFELVDDLLEQKVAALKLHRSQGERLYMQEDKIRSAANFRGAQIDLGHCEGFIPYKLVL